MSIQSWMVWGVVHHFIIGYEASYVIMRLPVRNRLGSLFPFQFFCFDDVFVCLLEVHVERDR